LTGHEQDIYSLDFSRDGRIVVSGSGDRTARIWDMADGSLLHTLVIKDNDQKDPGVTSVAISPDSRLVAAGSLDKMVRVWDAYDGKLLEQLEGHKDSVYSVAFMPDGHTLLSGSLDKTLKLWQLGGGGGPKDARGYAGDRDRTRNQCKMTFVGHKVSCGQNDKEGVMAINKSISPALFCLGLCVVCGVYSGRKLGCLWVEGSWRSILGSSDWSNTIHAPRTQELR
jgi:WD40 repeat protein